MAGAQGLHPVVVECVACARVTERRGTDPAVRERVEPEAGKAVDGRGVEREEGPVRQTTGPVEGGGEVVEADRDRVKG